MDNDLVVLMGKDTTSNDLVFVLINWNTMLLQEVVKVATGTTVPIQLEVAFDSLVYFLYTDSLSNMILGTMNY